ncbi:hypothetical protein HD_0425 [[Haemophilus] ducreyi 35000HP]|uniref:Uncharacterized protein n=1 Tax=Haemophilus ducreyi (strain 35000HP / ATCC 700724) TaxID=233412 RepID=Q7VNR2_HAEDU|nr:hypothetical protein HD_0425 [[Haemophilus] ducreyi 35000HP]
MKLSAISCDNRTNFILGDLWYFIYFIQSKNQNFRKTDRLLFHLRLEQRH